MTMGKHVVRALGIAALAAVGTPTAIGQDFYEGKTVRIIQPFGTGGAFDTVARLVTRHLNKHMRGKPTYVVESMPGAGGLIATNFIYSRAKPDGLTVGFLIADSLVGELLGSAGARFESDKLAWLGAPSYATPVCTFTAKSGIRSIAQWRTANPPPKIGTIATGGDLSYSIPRLLATQANLPAQLIVGHQGGNAALKLAAERGEIDGFCSSLEAATILWGDALTDGTVHVVVQLGRQPDPAIPSVPLARNIVTSPEGAELINVAVSGPQRINRAFAFPPGTPPEQVKAWRQALAATLADPALVEEAKRLRVSVNPIGATEIEKIVAENKGAPPDLVSKLRKILEAP
jgi:tripartite-type tricarboxylate transporter receptor subunit TctC